MAQASASTAPKGMSPWWTYLLSGIASILLGWFLLAKPVSTTISLVVFLGFYLLVAGIIDTVMSFTAIGEKGSAWGWKLLFGILSMIAGLWILNNPLFSAVFTPVMFMYFVAFMIIAMGLVKMFAGRAEANGHFQWTWGSFLLGAVSVIFGVWLLAAPDRYAVATVVLATGWYLLISGGVSMALAFVVKKEEA